MMTSRERSIPVSPEMAEACFRATKEHREPAIQVMAELLRPRTREAAADEFSDASRALSEEAIANGCTPEILADESKLEGRRRQKSASGRKTGEVGLFFEILSDQYVILALESHGA